MKYFFHRDPDRSWVGYFETFWWAVGKAEKSVWIRFERSRWAGYVLTWDPNHFWVRFNLLDDLRWRCGRWRVFKLEAGRVEA